MKIKVDYTKSKAPKLIRFKYNVDDKEWHLQHQDRIINELWSDYFVEGRKAAQRLWEA